MEVQIFGTKKDAGTRKAQRFFAERRVKTHFVDLTQRAASPGELRRFAQKFGTDALVDREGKRFRELGLAQAHLTDARWLDSADGLRVNLGMMGMRGIMGMLRRDTACCGQGSVRGSVFRCRSVSVPGGR
jgi:arsenate reductase-like glutaredoxin family protein